MRTRPSCIQRLSDSFWPGVTRNGAVPSSGPAAALTVPVRATQFSCTVISDLTIEGSLHSWSLKPGRYDLDGESSNSTSVSMVKLGGSDPRLAVRSVPGLLTTSCLPSATFLTSTAGPRTLRGGG